MRVPAQAARKSIPNGSATQLPQQLATWREHAGQPLAPAVRQKMEVLFQANFADVRVHVGPHVSAIGAAAFTQGTSIHFAPGQYDPASPRGMRALAHELTHVVQQRARRVTNPFGSGVAVVQHHALEGEAEAMAVRASVQQAQPAPPAPPLRPAPAVQRVAARPVQRAVAPPAPRNGALPIQRAIARPVSRPGLRSPHAGVVQRTITVGGVVFDDAATFAQQYAQPNNGGINNAPILTEVAAFLDSENKNFKDWNEARSNVTATMNLVVNPFSWVEPIVELARQIVREYPSHEYCYVGLGRSPVAIVEALRRLGHAPVIVPLGGLKLKSGTLVDPVLPDLTSPERGRIRNLIQQHIGNPGGRKILLMDYTQTGQGLRVGQLLIADATGATVVPLALEAGGFANPLAAQYTQAGMRRMTLPGTLADPTSVSSLIGGEALKPFSTFYGLTLAKAKGGAAPVNNPLVLRMRKAFELHRMAEDAIGAEWSALNVAVHGLAAPNAAGMLPFQAVDLAQRELDYNRSLIARAKTLADLDLAGKQVQDSRDDYYPVRLAPHVTDLLTSAESEKDPTKKARLTALARAIEKLAQPVWVVRLTTAIAQYTA